VLKKDKDVGKDVAMSPQPQRSPEPPHTPTDSGEETRLRIPPIPPDQIPDVSPIDRPKRKKKSFRMNFTGAVSKMQKKLNDTKKFRIKVASVRVLSSICNDLIERFTDDATKLTRDKNSDIVAVRSAEAAVKLNIPKSIEVLTMGVARRAVLKYNSHQATALEKEQALEQKFGDKFGDKKPKKDMKLKSDKTDAEVANMSLDDFCKEIRGVSKKAREAIDKDDKLRKFEKDKPALSDEESEKDKSDDESLKEKPRASPKGGSASSSRG